MRRLVHDVITVHNVIVMRNVIAAHDRIEMHMARQLRQLQFPAERRELRRSLKAAKCQYATFWDAGPTNSFAPSRAQHQHRTMAADESNSKSKPNKREDLDARLKEACEGNDWNWSQQLQQLRVGCGIQS